MPPKIEYKQGQILGHCIFINEVSKSKTGIRRANFKCRCGNYFMAHILSVKFKNTQSCGCIKPKILKELRTTHGLSDTIEAKIWSGIKKRCLNPNSNCAKNYIHRGITMCERWASSFESFLQDMGKRPSAKHSIERIDNNGNYEPGNCIWATQKQQGRNKRNNVMITYMGETLCISEWAERYAVNHKNLRTRIKLGWEFGIALTTPYKKYKTIKSDVKQ